jgi:choline dehydrogenase-like flavoprotein
MTFRNADKLADAELVSTDICIVGAGAAGITLALELEKSRFRVTLLESGGVEALEDADQLNDLEIAGHPLNVKAPIRRRALGGTTIATYGRSVLLDPIEFESRPWVSPKGWPIELNQLRRWYPQAADILALPRVKLLEAENWLQHPLPKIAGKHQLSTRIHLWGENTNLGSAWESRLRESENIQVLLRATALHCEADATGSKITQLACRGLNGGTFSVHARVFILACGGMENPRMLLLSRAAEHAPAINWDPVGRFYMNHPRSQILAKIRLKRQTDRSSKRQQLNRIRWLIRHNDKRAKGALQFALSPSEELQRNEGLLNVSSFFYAVSDQKTRDASSQLNKLATAWSSNKAQVISRTAQLSRYLPTLVGGAIHRFQDKPYRADHLVVVDQCEQTPDYESRLLLGEGVDRFACPKPLLDWQIGPDTTRSLRRLHALMAKFFGDMALGSFESKLLDDPSFEPHYQDCAHPTGTTRMSDNDHDGVVDRNCRVHGLQNLFMAGSSVFPVGGHASPTFIIIALAARLAAHLKKDLPEQTN